MGLGWRNRKQASLGRPLDQPAPAKTGEKSSYHRRRTVWKDNGISPIYLGEKVWQEGFDREFSLESVAVSKALEDVYEKIAGERKIGFMKASAYVRCSESDQEHLDAEGHQVFAEAVYEAVNRVMTKE